MKTKADIHQDFESLKAQYKEAMIQKEREIQAMNKIISEKTEVIRGYIEVQGKENQDLAFARKKISELEKRIEVTKCFITGRRLVVLIKMKD